MSKSKDQPTNYHDDLFPDTIYTEDQVRVILANKLLTIKPLRVFAEQHKLHYDVLSKFRNHKLERGLRPTIERLLSVFQYQYSYENIYSIQHSDNPAILSTPSDIVQSRQPINIQELLEIIKKQNTQIQQLKQELSEKK